MKNWLERNKIYFEVFSSSLLGAVALILSIVSIMLTYRQTKNEELLNQPRIKVSNEIFSYSGNGDDSRFVVVTNEGGQLTEFNGEMRAFLKIEFYKKPYSTNAERGVLYIPVLDYFGGQAPINNFQGTVTQFIGVNNLNLVSDLDVAFRKKFGANHPMTFLNEELILQVGYENYKGDKISKIFLVDRVGGGKEVVSGNSKVKERFNNWNALKGVHLYALTADKINEMIESEN